MDIHPSFRPQRKPPRSDTPPGSQRASGPRIPPILRDEKRLVPLVFGSAAAIVFLVAVVWYAVGLPGAPESVRRTLGRLPVAGPRVLRSPPPASGQLSLIAGLPCGEAWKRRPLAVMLGSDPIARPISGFAEADLVFEVPVLTNNVTRHLAVYQCGRPKEIGGVRSARHDYLFLAKGLDAVLAHWGGSYHALNRIRSERAQNGVPVYESIDALRNPHSAYYRVSHLPAPYNGYTTYDRLWEALKALGYRTYSTFQGYPHTSPAPRSERGTGTLDIGWPGTMRVRYVYNPETNTYERHWGGVRHVDGVENQPVNPSVIVVMHAEQRFAQGPGGYNDVDVEGTGAAEVYQNGQEIRGTWSKSEAHKQDPLLFTTPLGQPIEFVPGQVWVHVIDSRTSARWTPGTAVPSELNVGETPANFGE